MIRNSLYILIFAISHTFLPLKAMTFQIDISNKYDDIFSYQYKDIQLMNYEPYDHIKAPVSV